MQKFITDHHSATF